MARSVNQVFLIGRLTKDVEIRSTPSGKKVGNFSIAVDKQSGEGADFFEVTVWEKLADLMEQYTHKGSKIHLQGSMSQDVWEQDGNKRSKIKIVARDVTFLDSARDSQETQQIQQTQQPTGNDVVPTEIDGSVELDLDSIPF